MGFFKKALKVAGNVATGGMLYAQGKLVKDALGNTTQVGPVSTTEAERRIKEIEMQNLEAAQQETGMMTPAILQRMGYKNVDGKLVAMTESERMNGMNAQEQSMLSLWQEQLNNALKAERGDVELPAYLQQDLDKQMSLQNNALSAKLGSNWNLSTPGVQTASEALKRNAYTKSQYGQQERQLASGLATQSQNNWNANTSQYAAFPQRRTATTQMAASTLQPYQFDKQLQAGIDMQNSANQAQSQAGLLGLLGSVGGAAIMASSKDYKTGIKKVSDNEDNKNLSDLKKMNIVRYKYKPGLGDGSRHIGLLAEEAGDVATPDKKAVNLYDFMSKIASASQALAKRVDQLEVARG